MAEPRAPRTERDDPEDMTPTTSHERDADSLKEEKSPGVSRIEAIVSTFTSFDKIMLYIGIILGSYGRGVSGMTNTPFQAAAVSEWNAAGQTATLSVLRAAIASSSQPVWAKIMDYLGRPFVLFAGTVFYIVGYIVMATATNFGSLAGGLIIYVFGFGAQNIFLYIIIADSTSLRWRLFFSMIPSLHAVINAWASGVIAKKILAAGGGATVNGSWRWGYGFGALSWPVLAIPLFLVIIFTSLKAKRRGLFRGIPGPAEMIRKPIFWRDFFWKADIIGLFFLCASICLCLIPLTLGGGKASKWKTAGVIAPIVIGFTVSVPAFVIWEWKFARHPIIPFRLLKNRHILLSLAMGVIVTMTGAAQSTYLYFTLVVAFGRSVDAATSISKIANCTMAVAGLVLGVIVRYVGRVKPFAIAGAALYIVSYGILYRYRGGHTSSDLAGLIGGEVLIGIAGAFAQNSVQTGLQAVVKHEHVAVISALYFACFQVGAGLGGAITGAIWTNVLPSKLASALEGVVPDAAAQAAQVYGNPLKWIVANPVGSPAREAVDSSYQHVQRLLCASGMGFSALLFLCSLGLDNPKLTDKRSIDDNEDWSTSSASGAKGVGADNDVKGELVEKRQ